MLGKEKNTGQLDLFRASLQQIIDLEHPLVALSLTIPWEKIEKDFEQFYPTQGAPSHPPQADGRLTALAAHLQPE